MYFYNVFMMIFPQFNMFYPLAGLHEIWEMLYIQWKQDNIQKDKAGRYGKWPGDHAGHSAG